MFLKRTEGRRGLISSHRLVLYNTILKNLPIQDKSPDKTVEWEAEAPPYQLLPSGPACYVPRLLQVSICTTLAFMETLELIRSKYALLRPVCKTTQCG